MKHTLPEPRCLKAEAPSRKPDLKLTPKRPTVGVRIVPFGGYLIGTYIKLVKPKTGTAMDIATFVWVLGSWDQVKQEF